MSGYTRPKLLTHRRRAAAAVALATALGVTLAACGDGSDAGSPSSTQTASNGDVFNGADVSFASDMIQHHAQALTMVDLTEGRVLDPDVQQLAEDIRAAQGPEIEVMSDWLTAWDEEVPETIRDHSNAGHDMGGDMSEQMEGMEDSDMPGMMSGEEMDELQDASDGEFQDMWLEMMVEHHEGAVAMAKSEQEDGKFSDAVELATTIESAQMQEIEQMKGLLG
ncbi:DUF305 domain-containing protein [Nocardioides endophyticus]|uniref:DUF305 domain-containing protein n=1 Tax=Nocardioides endophyticus TaxID=1353775 RepID=A0ABP8Z7A5_9ACTN